MIAYTIMFGWLKRRKSHKNSAEAAGFPADHVIRTNIAGLVRATIMNQSMLRETAKPNCAIVLDRRGDVSLRWLSELDEAADVISFVMVSQLASYRELLQACIAEIKAGVFGEAFLDGPASMLFDRVAIEALDAMKKASS